VAEEQTPQEARPSVAPPRRRRKRSDQIFRGVIYAAAIVVFHICLYAFLLGNDVFDGDFENEPIPWYFLAKGIFCSLSLCLSVRLLDAIESLRARSV